MEDQATLLDSVLGKDILESNVRSATIWMMDKAKFYNNPHSFRVLFRKKKKKKTNMRFPGKVLINNNTLEFSFHDLFHYSIYSIFHKKRNINVNFLLPWINNHKVRFSCFIV